MKTLLLLALTTLSTIAADLPSWKLVWSDEFNNPGLADPLKWNYEEGLVRNQENQYYTRARQQNARVENGKLVIEAHKESMGGGDYTSASLITLNRASWQYGRFEVRAKLPSARGTWPAIWMMPRDGGSWPRCGEMDIMEHVGYNPGTIHGTLHSEAYNHLLGNQRNGTTYVQSYSWDYHVYSMDWSANKLTMSVDGNDYVTFNRQAGDGVAQWPFDKPFYLILNLAVGGSWGGLYGIDDAAFPQRMEVDYVRVYELIDRDADDDYFRDGEEIQAGSNPNSSTSNPFDAPGSVVLIDPTTRNGSFEEGSGTQYSWEEVNGWGAWTGVSTANDSGVGETETTSHGSRYGFMKSGNAAVNMSSHVVAEGDVFTCRWDHVKTNPPSSSLAVSLVYHNGGAITSIAATEISSTAVGWGQGATYTVRAGDPAIGKTIGIGMHNKGGTWLHVDNFRLVVNHPTDSDSDGLSDAWELTYSSNLTDLNGLATGTGPGEGTGDFDGDGLTDMEEFNQRGNYPLIHPKLADTDGDSYRDSAEVRAASDPTDNTINPFNAPGSMILIDPTTRNGSFEDGTGKQYSWDDVNHWDNWTGRSTANNDSGVENDGTASQGTRIGFLQPGNAAFNLTNHVIEEGDVFTYRWDHVKTYPPSSSHTASLIYDNGGTITSIAATEVTSTTVGLGKGTTYTVLAGDPVIGKTIGIGIRNNAGTWFNVDNFRLVIHNIYDSDYDDLLDDWEFTYTSDPADLNGLASGPGPGAGTGDFDGDGLTDMQEFNLRSTYPHIDPMQADTDWDSYRDSMEIRAGSNPTDNTSTPFNVPGSMMLIDPNTRNGSFEEGSGKQYSWNDVNHWDNWTGLSTINDNSGVEYDGTASHGIRIGFLQPGNAAFNMTNHVIEEGDIFTYCWDHVKTYPPSSSHTVSLVYDNGGIITSIAATELTSTTVGHGKGTTYTVLAGDPAIGKTIGIGIRNNNAETWVNVDHFRLVVLPAANPDDSDSDGMNDTWEIASFGNLNQTAGDDFDNDGTDNLTEFRLGLAPNSSASRFSATLGIGGLIQWPSATDVSFRIERSATLAADSWIVLEAAFPGTAGTASYTDPSPPVGQAFYKIGLNP